MYNFFLATLSPLPLFISHSPLHLPTISLPLPSFSLLCLLPLLIAYIHRLVVQIDPKGDNNWLDCVDIEDVKLPEGWTRKSYIGLTASTGQLSGVSSV